MSEKKNIKQNEDIVKKCTIFFLCLLPRIAINFFVKATPGGHDDLGTLLVPAILAGCDWSGLIPNTAYYGFGYSILYTPILMLFKDNSYLMFQAIFALNAIVQSLMAVLIYHILIKHYKKCDSLEAICISISMSYLVFTASCKVANDVILPFITWILVWILILLFENQLKTKKNRLTIILVMVLGYSLTLHSRSIVYWVGIICTILVARVLERRWLVNLKIFIVMGIIVYLITMKGIEIFQFKIWTELDDLTNSTSVIGTMVELGIKSIVELNAVKMLFTLAASNLFAIIQYTFGFFLIGLIGFFIVFYKLVRKKLLIQDNDGLIIGLLFSNICFLIMYVGICISYVFQAVPAYENKISFSGFFYIRYYYNFAVPLIMFGMLFCIENIKKRISLKIVSIALFIFTVCTIVVIEVLGEMPLRDYWTSFGVKIGGDDNTILTLQSYIIIYSVTYSTFAGFYILMKYFQKIAIVMLIPISIYSYAYQNLNSAKNWAENYIKQTNEFEEVLNEFDFSGEEYHICVPYQNAAYGLQLRKINYTIHTQIHEKKKNICMLGSPSEEMMSKGYYMIRISEDEVIYLNDKETYELIKQREDKK